MKSKPKKEIKAGFTLAEMLVSVFIIVTIASLFIANYNSVNKRTDLIMSAQKLVADIHYAQNNTLGLVEYNGSVPNGGWGLNLEKGTSTYVIFADLNAPGELGYMEYDNNDEGQIGYGARVTDLGENVEISSLVTGVMGETENPQVNVTFLPPDPQTNIYNGNETSTVLTIVLREKRNSTTKTIRVNFLGLAEVLD